MLTLHHRPLTPDVKAKLGRVGLELSPFRSNWSATLTVLDKELRALRARASSIVLMVDVTERDIRVDGQIRANARPTTPAVALAFESQAQGPLMFTCGRFRNWQDNVRAIALGLEALRKVDRYGITTGTEQYTGFRAIAAESQGPEDWTLILARHSGWTPGMVADDPVGAYRQAVKITHPDQGGNKADFLAVQAAWEKSRQTSS